jgi:hypothetical protein
MTTNSFPAGTAVWVINPNTGVRLFAEYDVEVVEIPDYMYKHGRHNFRDVFIKVTPDPFGVHDSRLSTYSPDWIKRAIPFYKDLSPRPDDFGDFSEPDDHAVELP